MDMSYMEDRIEPGTYRGMLLVDDATGHAELRELTAWRFQLDDKGNAVDGHWVVRSRDGQGEESLLPGAEPVRTGMLLMAGEKIPSVGYLAIGSGIVGDTVAWEHLSADLEALADGSVGAL